MNLTKLLSFFNHPYRGADVVVNNLVLDSRKVTPNDVFLALPGLAHDGRDYITQALQRGACAVLTTTDTDLTSLDKVDRDFVFLIPDFLTKLGDLCAYFYDHPSNRLPVVAITGTNGKTSCCHYIAQIFSSLQQKFAVCGTIGNGLIDDLSPSPLTTLDCCSLQQQLASFVQHNLAGVALEASSHAIAQGRLNGTKIKIAVFTNLTQDHLDYHPDMQSYFLAKAQLFTQQKIEYAVVNLDDKYGQQLLALIPEHVKVYAYTTQAQKYRGVYTIELCGKKVISPFGNGDLQHNLIGAFNNSNLLASITCCCLLGLPLDKVLEAAGKVTSVPGRMQIINSLASDLQVIVDYAHTPDALQSALQALKPLCKGKLWCVFGCGGDRGRSKRPLMLAAVASIADNLVLTNDNPRTENPQQIVNDMLQGKNLPHATVIYDRQQAINHAIQNASDQDIVLIAGKGHEDYQIIGEQRLNFSDAAVAESALQTRSQECVL